MSTKQLDKIDIELIRKEILSLPDFESQLPIQGSHEAVGRLDIDESTLVEKLYDLPYINSILDEFDMYRTRVLRLNKKSCYSLHSDPTPRIHIPIHTNEHSFFVIDNKVYYLDPGFVWWTDTTKPHTFVNAGYSERIHLVGCVNA